MIGALVIVFREILEAGLIIGIVLAATRGVHHRTRWISIGIGGGFLGACGVAVLAGFIGQLFHGFGQEIFNALVLITAVVLLAWHNVWMSTHGREMAADAKALGSDVASGKKQLWALALVVAIAVLREGSEVVLFLFSLAASDHESWQVILSGGVCGLLLGAIATLLLYWGLVAIPVRYFFSVTSALMTLLAGGLAAQACVFLQQAGYVTLGADPVWNTSSILPDASWFGRVLHTLIGYSDEPSGLQLTVYVLTVLSIALLTKAVERRASFHRLRTS